MLQPGQRRTVSYLSAGALSCTALQQLACGSFGNAHLLSFASTGILLVPTLLRNCSWFGPVETRFHTSQREVWLTIDDGPDPHDTPEMLDVLAEHQARATFFAIGTRILRWPHLAQKIIAAGHQLQNHTLNHPSGSFWLASPHRAEREISMASEAIASTTGIIPTLFRAPVGLANPFVHAAAEKNGLRMIGWSAAGWDGLPHQPDRVIERIVRSLRPGAIILLHEGAMKGMPRSTRARTLHRLLCRLEAEGYSTTLPPV